MVHKQESFLFWLLVVVSELEVQLPVFFESPVYAQQYLTLNDGDLPSRLAVQNIMCTVGDCVQKISKTCPP